MNPTNPFIVGTIYGKDLSEIHFVYDSLQPNGTATPIELGQILVLDDKVTKKRILVRITNIEFGQNLNWSKEVARGYNHFQNQQSNHSVAGDHESPGQTFQADRKDQLYNVAICETLGYISDSNGQFLTPKTLPSYFSQVRILNESDFDPIETPDGKIHSLRDKLGDISFGNMRSGSEKLNIQAGVFEELLPKHIGVFAQTGGGKSNTMKVLMGSIMETMGKAGALIFEPHGEYIYDLKRHPLSGSQLLCFSQDGRDNARKLKISYQDLSVDALMNIKNQMNWTEPQERFMREVESIFRQEDNDWFRFVVETPVDSDEAEDFGPLPTTTLKKEFPNTNIDTIKATKSKLLRISNAPYLDRNPNASNIIEILSLLDDGKIVLIDMASLSGLQELLLSTILSSKVLSRRRNQYMKDRDRFEKMPSVSIVMEEAQRVLGKDGNRESNVFAQICNEGRKFRTGLIAITQQPKLLSETLISQFNTLIILSISDQRDFEILSGMSKKPIDKLRTEIRSLMPGQAIVTNPLTPFALPMQVYFYDDYIKMVGERVKDLIPKKPKKDGFKGMV